MKIVRMHSFLHIFLLLSLLLSVGLLFAACQKEEHPPIKIGILHSLTGTMATSAKPVVDATLLAIEEINNRGGVLGRQLIPLIADGKSDPATFAKVAERLITQDKVAALFGCWTSACRKALKPVVEKYNNVLFYPLQYEGFEQSDNIIYTGATANQQVIPAISWAAEHLGKRLYLIGSDYIFPHAVNWIIKKQAALLGLTIVGEAYLPLGSTTVEPIITDIMVKKADVVINAINGDSNNSFFHALAMAGLSATKLPVLSFSIGETALASMPNSEDLNGHYAAWSYFQSLKNPENSAFVAAFKQRFGADRVISDPMATAYFSVLLWAQIVNSRDSVNVDSIIDSLKSQSISSPEGVIATDFDNHHTWRKMRIGRVNKQNQFDIVWESGHLIAPHPYPLQILPSDGEQMINQYYKAWGHSWVAPKKDAK
ncbi:MAG: urea ABC transporter substrate-binding protein [Mariprofundus sp.]|nr:urea ABC transporter substrate-binding protein [Mariprofundus sp.]